MEDFIERVGQSYLERKAFAVPQQLENFAKKQLTGGGEKEAEAKKSAGKKAIEEEGEGEEEEKGEEDRATKKKGSGKTVDPISSGSSEKDKEIARLKKQLVRSKLERPKASSGKSAPALKGQGISRASNGQKAFTSKAAKGAKKTKGLAALGAVGAVGGRHGEGKNKSGEKEASGRMPAKEANIVEISPTKRRTSTTPHNERDGGAKSKHGGGSKSEHGGHAESNTSHVAAASKGERRPSNSPQSKHGHMAKSIAPALVHNLPSRTEGSGGEKALVERRPSGRQNEHERDLCAVEVEEEIPRRKKEDAGGVVEVESSKGKWLYRVG